MAEFLITYLIYILALVAVVFLFLYFHARIQILKIKHDFIHELIEHDYQIDNINLNNYLK